MDLNEAMIAAKAGAHVRDEPNMREGWTVRWVEPDGLFYYFDPYGEQKHKIAFNDAHRSSYQWRVVPRDKSL